MHPSPRNTGWIEVICGPMFSGKTEELIRRGYTAREIEKIWGGNFLRVFQKVLDLAGK